MSRDTRYQLNRVAAISIDTVALVGIWTVKEQEDQMVLQQ